MTSAPKTSLFIQRYSSSCAHVFPGVSWRDWIERRQRNPRTIGEPGSLFWLNDSSFYKVEPAVWKQLQWYHDNISHWMGFLPAGLRWIPGVAWRSRTRWLCCEFIRHSPAEIQYDSVVVCKPCADNGSCVCARELQEKMGLLVPQESRALVGSEGRMGPPDNKESAELKAQRVPPERRPTPERMVHR